jgi:hypothetical protein
MRPSCRILTLAVISGLCALSLPASAAGPTCLQIVRIDHTTIPDDSTILFHMRDGSIWKNSLPTPCVGLRIENGFGYDTATDDICSNLQTIRVLRHGSICTLGTFTPYERPKTAG